MTLTLAELNPGRKAASVSTDPVISLQHEMQYNYEKSLSFAVALCRLLVDHHYRVRFRAAGHEGQNVDILLDRTPQKLPELEVALARLNPIADRQPVLDLLNHESRRSHSAVLFISLRQVSEGMRDAQQQNPVAIKPPPLRAHSDERFQNALDGDAIYRHLVLGAIVLAFFAGSGFGRLAVYTELAPAVLWCLTIGGFAIRCVAPRAGLRPGVIDAAALRSMLYLMAGTIGTLGVGARRFLGNLGEKCPNSVSGLQHTRNIRQCPLLGHLC